MLINFQTLNHPFISRINSMVKDLLMHFSGMVYDLLMHCWILFAIILLRIFASMFMKDFGL